MTNEIKLSYFRDELDLITDEQIRKFIEFALVRVPDYIFEVPASSSGKYHPEKAREPHGLIYHTKLAVKIGVFLMNTIQDKQFAAKTNEIIGALIFHDCQKSGKINCGHTVNNHPLLASLFLREVLQSEYLDTITSRDNPNLDEVNKICQYVEELCYLIDSHMGKWNCGYMPIPDNPYRLIVHQADYLAANYDKLDVIMPKYE